MSILWSRKDSLVFCFTIVTFEFFFSWDNVLVWIFSIDYSKIAFVILSSPCFYFSEIYSFTELWEVAVHSFSLLWRVWVSVQRKSVRTRLQPCLNWWFLFCFVLSYGTLSNDWFSLFNWQFWLFVSSLVTFGKLYFYYLTLCFLFMSLFYSFFSVFIYLFFQIVYFPYSLLKKIEIEYEKSEGTIST